MAADTSRANPNQRVSPVSRRVLMAMSDISMSDVGMRDVGVSDVAIEKQIENESVKIFQWSCGTR